MYDGYNKNEKDPIMHATPYFVTGLFYGGCWPFIGTAYVAHKIKKQLE
jgi:hypothetical protein